MNLQIANSVIEAIAILSKIGPQVATSTAVWSKVHNAQKHLDKELKQYLSGE